ncbi:MAG: hypothetical protein RBG13Loki_0170 [Promethearchaeota archaeon CR_4]|nr:MAG: hypothetical protein RBG13Loki_0170 [Candidatus Lokiarchaeota archaeon CR_4]
MTGVTKLQKLIEKSAFLKQRSPNIPDILERTWDDEEKVLNAFRMQVRIMRDILEDMNLAIDEIPRLDQILEEITKISHNFQTHHQKIASLFQFLVKIIKTSKKLATPIPYVSNVETSMTGDHIWGVEKDKLFFGDFEIISSFIGNLHKFFAVSPGGSVSSEKFPLKDLLTSLRTTGGRLLDEFLPGVVYEDIPDIVEEIGRIGRQLEVPLAPHKYIIDHNFFIEDVRKARESLMNLVVTEKTREQKPLKLKGFLGTKKEGKALVELFENLSKLLQL